MSSSAFQWLNRFGIGASQFDLYHHQSGAQVVHKNHTAHAFSFAIGFPTPAPDNSGLTHVLEHMIFRGSQLHSDDQLYNALRSGSLAFHLNASTGAEFTAYHFATASQKDALRLQEALLAAVFRPLLRADAFNQEAYDAHLGQGGVVYNEMMGHLAQKTVCVEHHLRAGLFGPQPLGSCYGGQPGAIAGLKLGDVAAFHHHYYQPNRALIYLSGDQLKESFSLLDQSLVRGVHTIDESIAKIRAHICHGVYGDYGYWGMIFPDGLNHWQKLVLGEAILGLAQASFGPRFLGQSGFVDASQPYIALYWQGEGHFDLAKCVDELDQAALRAAQLRVKARLSNDEENFRFPPDLQVWPQLCAAFLRNRLAQDFGPDFIHEDVSLSSLTSALENMDRSPIERSYCPAVIPAYHAQTLPTNGVYTPLDLKEITQPSSQSDLSILDGVKVIEAANQGFMRVCLWCDGGPLTWAEQRYLPTLAASAGHALEAQTACYNGNRIGLLIEKYLPHDEVNAWLARCEIWFENPPVIGTYTPPPLHVLAEFHLRAHFSTAWQNINRLIGFDATTPLAPTIDLSFLSQWLRQNSAPACSDAQFSAALRPWVKKEAKLTQALPLEVRPKSRVIANCALSIVGMGYEFKGFSPEHILVAKNAIEFGFLWPKLRSSSGAYGVRSSCEDQILTLTSIRDPQGPQSLIVMEAASHWLRDNCTDADVIHRAKLAALAHYLRPLTLSERLRGAVLSPSAGYCLEKIKSVSADDLGKIGDNMRKNLPHAARLMLASEQTFAKFGLKPNL